MPFFSLPFKIVDEILLVLRNLFQQLSSSYLIVESCDDLFVCLSDDGCWHNFHIEFLKDLRAFFSRKTVIFGSFGSTKCA